jgi:hypothetical protein
MPGPHIIVPNEDDQLSAIVVFAFFAIVAFYSFLEAAFEHHNVRNPTRNR